MNEQPTWIVVADGGGARFFIRARPGMPLAEMQQLSESDDVISHRHGRPAIPHDRVGHGRHSVTARTTPHEHHEQLFLRHVAGQIDRAVIEHAVGELVLCAPPHVLGMLRDFVTDNTRRCVKCEIAKDYLHETTDAIDEHLRPHNV